MSRKHKPNGQHVNGTLPGSPPGKPPESQTLLESQDADTKRVVKATLESFFGAMSDGFGGGSDVYYDLLQDRYGQGKWVPISVVSDRSQGANWPLWRNEVELAEYRQRSRIVCEKNAYAKALLTNLQTHIIGKGFAYKAQPKTVAAGPAKGLAPDETTAQVVDALQKVVDEFCTANRFTAAIVPNGSQSLVTSSREWEAFRRVMRDGEAIIRLFKIDNPEDEKHHGKTYVRFVEPEQVTQPSDGCMTEGWSFGIKHKMEPFEDEEDFVAYWVKYKDSRDGKDGEEVDADDIVHIKGLAQDAAIKRGLPAFSLDTLDALERASKLTRNVSISSAVRAATAEIWQHEKASEAQVQSLATRLSNPNPTTNPITGRNQLNEQRLPGQTRRIPAGQVPVWPQAVGASEHIEVAQSDLRQASAAFCAPEYFTGDASNANYNSTKEAGVPFVVMAETTQEHFKIAFLVCILKAIAHAISCGLLPSNTMKIAEIQVSPPKLAIRDPLQQAQEDQILNGMKVKSVPTIQMERGLDPDHESASFEEFEQKHGQPGGAMPMPGDDGGMGGDPFGGGGDEPPQNPYPDGGQPRLESTEVDQPRKFSSTQLDLSGDAAKTISEMAKAIPDFALAGDGREANPHITVKYGLHTDSPEAVAGLIRNFGPVEVTFGETSVFPASETGGFDVVKVDVDGPKLRELNKLIGDTLKCTDTHPEYKPHVTLAYVKFAHGAKFVGPNPLAGTKATFYNLTFSPPDGEKAILPLAGTVTVESRLLENFTGIDAHGHRWVNGKQVAIGKGENSHRESEPKENLTLPANWKISNADHDFEIEMRGENGKRQETFSASKNPRSDDWGVVFADKNYEEDATGKAGNAAVGVFRRVGVALNEFIQKKEPVRFNFQANGKEPSRVSLYHKLAKRIADQYGYDLTTSTAGTDGTTNYYFKKSQGGKPIAESLGAFLESLDADFTVSMNLLENFTGIDANGHHWQNGKQVATPKEAAAVQPAASHGESHVESWASYASKIPAKVMGAAKAKVQGHYAKLAERYGQNTALLIMGAGLAGVPIPVPGSSLITAAPIIAVAEAIRFYKSRLLRS